jgi:hypothetical protein
MNRVYESAGPEGKVRGTPQQIVDKYLTLARDAQTSGDRVVAENFLQHAEHYQRILLEAMGPRPERRDQASEQDLPDIDDQDDDGDSDSDSDSDSDTEAASQPEPERREPSRRDDGNRRRHERRPSTQSEVSGLTTIDSGEGGSLLVDAEDLSASQPRRRRRPEAAASDPAPADAEAQSD